MHRSDRQASREWTVWIQQVLVSVVISMLIAGCASGEKEKENRSDLPNIILILADDLGYGELGVYGQEKIETPHLDELAATGMVFTQHYAGAPVCAPSRCVLLTGKHMGHAAIRGNDEWTERGDVWDYVKAVEDPYLEGQRPLPGSTVTIGSILQEVGYRTAIVGKWGLGAPLSEGIPNNRGFDFFFGYNCQRQAHTYYPRHLWENKEKVWLDNPLVVPGTLLEQGEDPMDPENYRRYRLQQYSPDLMQKEVLHFIRSHQKDPFFLYYATPIPHAPLQAPERWLDHYVDKFGDEPPYDGSRGYFPSLHPRATYAAMVSFLDEQVGEIVRVLRELGIERNTLIIFSSDNGPTYNGGTSSPWFNSGGPFQSEYGKGKGFLQEGGIRVPFLARWPGKINAGSRSDQITAFYDVFPTLCELAGADIPEDIDGVSFLPILLGEEMQSAHEYLYWEFPEYGGQVAIRMGKWKGLAREIKLRDEVRFELYDLTADPMEKNNLAGDHPEIIEKLHQIVQKEHLQPEIELFRLPQLGDSIP